MTAARLDLLLDDPVSIQAGDPGGILRFAGALGEQLREGFEIGRAAATLPRGSGLGSVVVCGMGGSGITGDVLHAALSETLPVPLVTSKGYRLPSFCGPGALVIAVSYSGNTEETIASYAEAVSRRCPVVAVASGGELLDRAARDDVPVVRVPANAIAPRAALGYLVGAGLGVLAAMGLGSISPVDIDRTAEDLTALAARLGPHTPTDQNDAKRVAAWLLDGTPLVWGTEGVAEAAARRWKTQLNENAKTAAFFGALPELDHNEVEGWSGGGGDAHRLAVLRTRGEPEAMNVRVAATIDAMASVGLEAREIWSEGETALEQLCSLIMVGDFVSIYLAILRGVDPTPIPLLTALKKRREAGNDQES